MPSIKQDSDTLRARAEQRLKTNPPPKFSSDADHGLVHELQVHQIELEMRNEELSRAEVEARQAADKYAELFDFAPLSYFVLDPQGLVSEVNLAGASLVGLDRQRVVGQPFTEYVISTSREAFREFCLSVRPGEPRRSHETRLVKFGQGACDVLVDGSFAELKSVRGHGCRLAVTDITERKRFEEALRQTQRRIIDALEAERERAAVELHEGVNQLIASATIRFHHVESRVAAVSPATREMFTRCHDLLLEALEENRRIAHYLRPSDLDQFGLAEACRNFCNHFQSRTNLVVEHRIARRWPRMPSPVELNLFRIVQEALENVQKHAQAKTVRLRLASQNGSFVLRIEDDGCGFEPQTITTDQTTGSSIGLTNMRERAAFLGGTCRVESAPKKGTIITVWVPA